MTKLLISDIDGTLIRQGKVALDRQKLENFRKSNTFVLCTGRNYDSFHHFTQKYAFDTFDYAILSNGAMLIDQEFNILYASEISLAVLKAQVAELATIEGINRLFLVINLKERIFDSVQDLLEAINDITESDSLLGLTMALTSNQAAQACFDQIKENPDLSIQHNHSYIDIISQGTNKKSGIATLLSKLESSRVQVIGDGENDIPMFETTDESYSFYDAPDSVKEKANYLVDCYVEIFET